MVVTPSISWLLLALVVNKSMRTVLVLLDLSIKVSVPTSNRPMSFGSMLYFSNNDLVTVRAMLLISSMSPWMRPMEDCPNPMVYLPDGTWL